MLTLTLSQKQNTKQTTEKPNRQQNKKDTKFKNGAMFGQLLLYMVFIFYQSGEEEMFSSMVSYIKSLRHLENGWIGGNNLFTGKITPIGNSVLNGQPWKYITN